MHAKALSIFNTIKANPNVTFAKKHSVEFFENVVHTNPNNQQQMKGNCMCCSKCVHQGPAAQQAVAREGKQARGHLPQPPSPRMHEQAQLRGACCWMELRGQPRGCHQVRRRGLRAAQEVHPNLSAEAARAPPWPEDEPLQLQLDQDGQPLMMLM